MISAVGVLCSGTTAVSYVPATDVQLIGVAMIGAATTRAAVSRDQTVATSALITPTGDKIDQNLLAVIGGGAIAEIPNIPVPSGERIYVACSAASTVVLYFQDNL